MTAKDIAQQQQEIYRLLSSRRLKDSFGKLSALIAILQDWKSQDKLNELETSYQYMIRYMLDGAEDPARKRIYDHLILSAYRLTDQVTDRLSIKDSPSLYYSRKRFQNASPQPPSIAKDMEVCDEAINNLSLFDLLNESERNSDKAIALKRAKENADQELFMDIWINYPATEEDYTALREALAPGHFPESTASLVVSAIALNLLHRFDEQKLQILLDGYGHDSQEVQIRALCSALIILFTYRDRIGLSESLAHRLEALAEAPAFISDVRTIFLQFIKSRDTEKITKKMNEELLPEMMKITPSIYKKIKQEDMMNDLTALEENPEWQNILEQSGITDKLQELNDLQMEGADVFMGTFSHLKNFPFFNEIQNWFLPFQSGHSQLSQVFGTTSNLGRLQDMIGKSAFLCNSDKYSFCFTLSQVPDAQRSMMAAQFGGDSAELQAEVNESLPKDHTRENISNRYIQDLYRFFKLYNRRNEFDDPFKTPIDLFQVPVLNRLLSDRSDLRLFGEYYFNRKYYTDALNLFVKLSGEYHSDHDVYQKIGYCYQMSGNYEEALEAYLKAEIIVPENYWTLRRIATCFRNLKKPEKALNYYLRAEKLKPDNISVEMNIGHCLLEQKEYEEALKYYFKVDYLDPNGQKAWQPIAWCSFLVGKQEQAQRYYQKILNGKPSASDYLNAGHVEFALGNIRQAIEYYHRSIDMEGGNSEKFLSAFRQDEPDLLRAGISANDIPILLDQLMYTIS